MLSPATRALALNRCVTQGSRTRPGLHAVAGYADLLIAAPQLVEVG
jgi:hypothetical protein